MFLRHFTPREANALLPVARERLERVRGLMREHQALRESVRATRRASGTVLESEAGASAQQRLESLHAEITDELKGLHALGVQVKSVEPFLLDFPALLDGRTVLLCWREGEESVEHFHSLDTGFNAREPIVRPSDFGATVLQ